MKYNIGDTWIRKSNQDTDIWEQYEIVGFNEDSYKIEYFYSGEENDKVATNITPSNLEDARYTYHPTHEKMLKVLEQL